MADEAPSIERAYGAQYVVEPGFTKKDIILLLKRSALAAEFLPDIKKRYGCKGIRCKNLAYLPLIIRPAWDEQADYYNRKYKFGLVACLDHHTFWPARKSDAEDFKRGRLPFLWLEFLREDRSSDDERGEILPQTEELAEAIALLLKHRSISREVAREFNGGEYSTPYGRTVWGVEKYLENVGGEATLTDIVASVPTHYAPRWAGQSLASALRRFETGKFELTRQGNGRREVRVRLVDYNPREVVREVNWALGK